VGFCPERGRTSTFSSRGGDEDVERGGRLWWAFAFAKENVNQTYGKGIAMRKIVTLTLLMLIGAFGTAQAQPPAPENNQNPTMTPQQVAERNAATTQAAETEKATKMEEATKEFLGLKWGLGVGVMGDIGGETAVEKASLVGTDKIVRVDEEGDMQPQMFMEMHAFLWGGGDGGNGGDGKVRAWKKYQQKQDEYQMKKARWKPGDPPIPQNNETPPPACPRWGVGLFVALQGSEKEVINSLATGIMWGIRKDATDSRSVNVGIGVSFDPSVQVLGHGLKEGNPLPAGETEVRFKKEGQLGWALMASFTF